MKKNNSLTMFIGAGVLGLLVLLSIVVALVAGYGIYSWSSQRSSTNVDPNQQFIPFRKGDKWGYCDKNKKMLIDAKYDWVTHFSDGLAVVWLNNKSGFIDKTGKVVIPSFFIHILPTLRG